MFQVSTHGITKWLGLLAFRWRDSMIFDLASIDELEDLYGQLPGLAGSNKTGDISPFEDIPLTYWSGTPIDPGAWVFSFLNGSGFPSFETERISTGWAVRAGDSAVAAVPEPASILLLGVGLSSLLAVRRRLRK